MFFFVNFDFKALSTLRSISILIGTSNVAGHLNSKSTTANMDGLTAKNVTLISDNGSILSHG